MIRALTTTLLCLILTVCVTSCAHFTTPMRDCKAMCLGPVVECQTADGEKCVCKEKS
jgi:hypothetical protein